MANEKPEPELKPRNRKKLNVKAMMKDFSGMSSELCRRYAHGDELYVLMHEILTESKEIIGLVLRHQQALSSGSE